MSSRTGRRCGLIPGPAVMLLTRSRPHPPSRSSPPRSPLPLPRPLVFRPRCRARRPAPGSAPHLLDRIRDPGQNLATFVHRTVGRGKGVRGAGLQGTGAGMGCGEWARERGAGNGRGKGVWGTGAGNGRGKGVRGAGLQGTGRDIGVWGAMCGTRAAGQGRRRVNPTTGLPPASPSTGATILSTWTRACSMTGVSGSSTDMYSECSASASTAASTKPDTST